MIISVLLLLILRVTKTMDLWVVPVSMHRPCRIIAAAKGERTTPGITLLFKVSPS